MRFGCLYSFAGTAEDLAAVEQLSRGGYQYMEPSADALWCGGDPEAYYAARRALRRAALVPEAATVDMPAALPLVGDDVQWQRTERYTSTVVERAEEVGVTTLVLDSAGARIAPEGYPRDEALHQLRYFLTLASDYAESVTIAVLPLPGHPAAAGHSIAETSELVLEVGRPEVRLAVDAVTVGPEGEDWEDLVAARNILAHVKWSDPNVRDSAAVQEKLEGVVEGLSAIGYDRRISLAPRPGASQVETVLLLQRLQGLCAKR